MARKFFNQKVKKSSSRSKIAYIIIGICLLLIIVTIILFIIFRRQMPEDAVIEIRDVVTVEVNSELPDKTLFFAELQNVKEDDIDISFAEADITKVGDYKVEITIFGNNYESTLSVVDTQAPILTVHNFSISISESYSASDFVESCSDNSGDECNISFYEMGMDQDGNIIDYSSYSEEGNYSIQIIATDASGNSTTATMATLTIGDSVSEPEPTSCSYGNDEYDSNTYILAVNVTQNGCALDANLYENETVNAPAYELADSDTEKLQKEINKLNINQDLEKSLNRIITPVLNEQGTGLVGYSIQHELTIIYEDGSSELVASYYISTNGERIYTVNKYNLA